MKGKGISSLILLGVLLALFSLPSSGFAAGLPDFNRLKILDISHSIERGPEVTPDPFYPEYPSLSYQVGLIVRIERPVDWDSSLLEIPDAVLAYIGRTLIDLYKKDGRDREGLASLRARCEIHPIWATSRGEIQENPSRISYFVPAFLLEKGARGQIDPKEMLGRGRAHFQGLLRRREGR